MSSSIRRLREADHPVPSPLSHAATPHRVQGWRTLHLDGRWRVWCWKDDLCVLPCRSDLRVCGALLMLLAPLQQ